MSVAGYCRVLWQKHVGLTPDVVVGLIGVTVLVVAGFCFFMALVSS